VPSEVIYARVPKPLKEAADAYAEEKGASLTKAVAELLDRGLSAASDQRSIEQLQKNLARVKSEKSSVESDLKDATRRLAVLGAFSERASMTVGKCPHQHCQKPITGYELLCVGKCRHCGQTLTSLIAPAGSASTLDQREVMLLFGALGAALGIAYLASK
jgi:hypothetical protein